MQVTDKERNTFEQIRKKMVVDEKLACQELVCLFEAEGPFEHFIETFEKLQKRAVTGSQEHTQISNIILVVNSVLGQFQQMFPVAQSASEMLIDAPVRAAP